MLMGSDLPELQIKKTDRFFNRLLSKETSISNSSFRIYHGSATGSVPFNWESQPGTPKHRHSQTTLPPLTPPPSYFSKAGGRNITNKSSSSGGVLRGSKILTSLFVGFAGTASRRIKNVTPAPVPEKFSGGFMVMDRMPAEYPRRRRRIFSSFDSGGDGSGDGGSPVSSLCFGISRSMSARDTKPYR